MATMRFAKLMKEMGHTVYLYGAEENDAPCDEFIPCITKEEQYLLLEGAGMQYQHTQYHPKNPLWMLFNPRAGQAIQLRKQPGDVICQITGLASQQVSDMNPDLRTIEYNIGYMGSSAECRVYQSKAWQYSQYGHLNINDVRFFDTVIPGFFDPDDFPFSAEKDTYCLYVGRYTVKKGVPMIGQMLMEMDDLQVKYIGHASNQEEHDLVISKQGEDLGVLDDAARNQYMMRAKAVLCPTTYIEPFNCVAVEAQLCGTPVIATNTGGFTETIEHGKTGFLCNTFGDFLEAIRRVGELDPSYIRARAESLYSFDAVKPLYEQYFRRVQLLGTRKGWNTPEFTTF